MFRYDHLAVVVALFVVLILFGVSAPSQTEPTASAQEAELAVGTNLSEVESLKGEVLRLRYDSLDKQSRLIQAQFVALQEQQQQIIAELQALEAKIIADRQLADPDTWTVNWQTGNVDKKPQVQSVQESPATVIDQQGEATAPR